MSKHIDYCNKQNLSNIVFDNTKAKFTRGLRQKLNIEKTKFNKKN